MTSCATIDSTASQSSQKWLFPPLDGASVEVTPLAAEGGRVTLRIRHNAQKDISQQFKGHEIVLKWCYSRKALSELDANRDFQSRRIVPLLGGRVVRDATLKEIIPGLSKEQYVRLRKEINSLANGGLGGHVIREGDYKLAGYSGDQDVLIQKYLSDQSFSPSKAACSPRSWEKRRRRLGKHIGQGLADMKKRGFCHGDPAARNIGVQKSRKSEKKYDFYLLDLGSVRRLISKEGAEDELGRFLGSVDTVRANAMRRVPPRDGAHPPGD